ncbi:MAG TPA: hypothetical protein VME69_07550 [Methylocella sp.]|nr:hypothetical protein [Methylocella sp.]
MTETDESLEARIVERDRKQAAFFWWVLMALRLVIPLYVIYAIYLYWTLPPSAYLAGGG